MSNPGPVRPPTDNPKFNVLFYYAMGAFLAAFGVVSSFSGLAKLVALPFVGLGVWLLVKIVRETDV